MSQFFPLPVMRHADTPEFKDWRQPFHQKGQQGLGLSVEVHTEPFAPHMLPARSVTTAHKTLEHLLCRYGSRDTC